MLLSFLELRQGHGLLAIQMAKCMEGVSRSAASNPFMVEAVAATQALKHADM